MLKDLVKLVLLLIINNNFCVPVLLDGSRIMKMIVVLVHLHGSMRIYGLSGERVIGH